jgi:hypothetical protein
MPMAKPYRNGRGGFAAAPHVPAARGGPPTPGKKAPRSGTSSQFERSGFLLISHSATRQRRVARILQVSEGRAEQPGTVAARAGHRRLVVAGMKKAPAPAGAKAGKMLRTFKTDERPKTFPSSGWRIASQSGSAITADVQPRRGGMVDQRRNDMSPGQYRGSQPPPFFRML